MLFCWRDHELPIGDAPDFSMVFALCVPTAAEVIDELNSH